MNRSEARQLLDGYMERYRSQNYSELASRVGQGESEIIAGNSGTKYNVEVHVFWDGKPGGDLRVRGMIDSGGLGAFLPLVDDYLVSP